MRELNCRKNLRWPLAEFIPIAFVRHQPAYCKGRWFRPDIQVKCAFSRRDREYQVGD